MGPFFVFRDFDYSVEAKKLSVVLNSNGRVYTLLCWPPIVPPLRLPEQPRVDASGWLQIGVSAELCRAAPSMAALGTNVDLNPMPVLGKRRLHSPCPASKSKRIKIEQPYQE